MRLSWALLTVLLLPAAAQAQEDVWKKLEVHHPTLTADKRCTCGVLIRDHIPALGKDQDCFCGERAHTGSRVEVLLPSGNAIRGYVVDPKHDPHARVKVRKLDFTKETAVTLDISLEYPNLNGTITFRKTDMKSIRILEPLSDADLKEIERVKAKQREEMNRLTQEYKARLEKIEAENKEAEARAKKEKSKEAMKEGVKEAAEKIQKAIDIYDKFPEKDGWGQEKMKELSVRANNKMPISLQEQDFMNNIQLWVLGKQYTEEQQKKGKNEEPPK